MIAEGIEVVICGGIGGPAMQSLMEHGIMVVPGVQGDIDVAVSSLLDGSLSAGQEPTCSSHDHHHEDGEGCHCGGHDEEGGCGCGGCCH